MNAIFLSLLLLTSGAVDDDGEMPAGEESAEATTQVAFFDLYPEDGVTKKQARGISLMVREQLEKLGTIEVKDRRKDDKKTRRKCNQNPKCLGKAAFSRGADLLLSGTLHAAEEGFELRLEVVLSREMEIDREVDGILAGGGMAIEAAMERLLREAVAPLTLAGALRVTGQPAGAEVLIDGQRAGKLPLERLDGLLEGTYSVEVTKKGYTSATRRVKIHFKEVTALEVTLIPTSRARKRQDEIAQGKEETSNAWLFAIPASLAATAVLSLGTGAVFAWLTQQEVDKVDAQAEAQMLFFPRDAELLQRGESYSLGANIAFIATGAFLLAAAGATGFLLLPEQTEEEETEAFSATGKKDFDDAEMQPALEGL